MQCEEMPLPPNPVHAPEFCLFFGFLDPYLVRKEETQPHLIRKYSYTVSAMVYTIYIR